MTDGGPPPLKSAGDTPDELVRALQALRDGNRDAARLARVGERLGAQIAGSGAGASASSGLVRMIGGKAGVAALAIGVGVLGVIGYRMMDGGRETAVPAGEASGAKPSVVMQAVQTEQQPQAQLQQQEPRVVVTAESSEERASKVEVAQARSVSRARRAKVPVVETATATETATEAETEAEAETETEAETEAEKRKADTEKKVVGKAPVQLSESALLSQARRLAVEKPEDALKLLREHAQRFASGMLTPEREVLTIEVLRRLGRSGEATQRLQAFEAKYPHSIYLRRLERGAAATGQRP